MDKSGWKPLLRSLTPFDKAQRVQDYLDRQARSRTPPDGSDDHSLAFKSPSDTARRDREDVIAQDSRSAAHCNSISNAADPEVSIAHHNPVKGSTSHSSANSVILSPLYKARSAELLLHGADLRQKQIERDPFARRPRHPKRKRDSQGNIIPNEIDPFVVKVNRKTRKRDVNPVSSKVQQTLPRFLAQDSRITLYRPAIGIFHKARVAAEQCNPFFTEERTSATKQCHNRPRLRAPGLLQPRHESTAPENSRQEEHREVLASPTASGKGEISEQSAKGKALPQVLLTPVEQGRDHPDQSRCDYTPRSRPSNAEQSTSPRDAANVDQLLHRQPTSSSQDDREPQVMIESALIPLSSSGVISHTSFKRASQSQEPETHESSHENNFDDDQPAFVTDLLFLNPVCCASASYMPKTTAEIEPDMFSSIYHNRSDLESQSATHLNGCSKFQTVLSGKAKSDPCKIATCGYLEDAMQRKSPKYTLQIPSSEVCYSREYIGRSYTPYCESENHVTAPPDFWRRHRRD